MIKWQYNHRYNPIRYYDQVDILLCSDSDSKPGTTFYAAQNIHGLTISKIEKIARKLEKEVLRRATRAKS